MASNSTSREGKSASSSIGFKRYLQRVAHAEVERACDELHADVFALVHPDRSQARDGVALEGILEDFEEVECAVRFLELVEDMEGAE